MKLEEADKIVTIWGRYIEYVGDRLSMVFGSKIPESLLPYSKEILLSAMRIMVQYYAKQGNEKIVRAIKETASSLNDYIDDEEALLIAANNLNNSEWRRYMIPAIKQYQKDWISTQ